jgi:hypothetical protein
VREISHSGATAGYRAYLVRYPDQRASIAVLCNAANANPTQYAHAVADAYLKASFTAPAAAAAGEGRTATPGPAFTPASADTAAYLGRYRSDEADVDLTVALERGELVVQRRPDTVLRMRAVARDVFAVPTLGTVTFHRAGGSVSELSVKLDRVWDLRFARLP